MRQPALILVALSAVVVAPAISHGQTTRKPSSARSHFTDGIIGQFDNSAADLLAAPATVSAKFTAATSDRPAILLITAKIPSGRHTYSLTQPPGGPQPTSIELQPSPNYRLVSKFRSQPAPKVGVEEIGPDMNIKVEEHEGEITWYAPIEITAGVDPKSLEVRGTIHMQVCETHGTCVPVEKEFVATLAASSELADNLPATNAQSTSPNPQSAFPNPKSQTGPYQPQGSSLTLDGRIAPSAVKAGASATIEIRATPPADGHLYAHADRDPKKGTKPVLIAIQSASGLLPQRATTDAAPKTENSPVFGPLKYHDSPVTWKLRIDVPKTAKPGDYPVSGLLGYQLCETGPNGNSTCELPHAVRFAVTVKVADAPDAAPAALNFAPGGSYSQVADAAAVFADHFEKKGAGPDSPSANEAEKPEPPALRASNPYELDRIVLDSSTRGSLSYYIALAFVGGLILNLMPCVLPVIGLKVMSFVEQSGHSRANALQLNLWFAAGIVSVFVLLGLLAATLGLSWGGQFGSTAFNVTIAAIVFAMALSLLGVWEIPIPGFFGSGSVQSAASKEGPLGAFLKGVITTILATPCTAPFMASAIAWAVTQTVATTLIVFATLGIGMASPYVLVGVYPELLRFLPKPGAWMESFKQIIGFVLLATVIFILSFIDTLAVVPTLVLLLGIGFACWLISRTPLTAEFQDRVKSWAVGGAIVLAFVGVSFGLLYRIAISPNDMAWQSLPFSLERLKQVAVEKGQTVLVDFSAEWCLNCKWFEKTVLHTKPVEQAIARSNAVTMYGDYTKYPPEIDKTIRALGANGVPVIAIFPGNNPYEPIVFRGRYRQQDLIAALDSASGRSTSTASSSFVESSASAAQ
jgi:suppressor for copper-sensitivity B